MRKDAIAIGLLASLCGIVAPTRARAESQTRSTGQASAQPAASPAFQIFGVFGFLFPDLPTTVMQASNGNFYGTTLQGPLGDNEPTIFKMTPSGSISVLHTFDVGEGAPPFTRLVQARDGALYQNRGRRRLQGDSRRGTHGDSSIHRPGRFDAQWPDSGEGREFLRHDAARRRLGTRDRVPHGRRWKRHAAAFVRRWRGSLAGGSARRRRRRKFLRHNVLGGDALFGTVFKMSPDGTPTFLHHFSGAGGDGALVPSAVIQGRDGALYGVTSNGGLSDHGVAFRLTTSGSFSVLHDFTGFPSGGNPVTALVQPSDGSLYGTATDAIQRVDLPHRSIRYVLGPAYLRPVRGRRSHRARARS